MPGAGALRSSRVLVGAVVAGIVAGLAEPDWAIRFKPLVEVFVNLLGWLAVPLLVCMLAASSASARHGLRLGRLGSYAALYFATMSLLSLVLGMVTSWVLEPGAALYPGRDFGVQPAARLSLDRVPGLGTLHLNVLLVLSAIPVGLLVRACAATRVGDAIERCRALLLRAINLLLLFSPLAAFSAMAYTVGQYGVHALLPLLAFIVAVNLASLLFVVLGLGTALRLARVPLLRLIAYLRDELLLVAATGSSMVGLTPLALKLERLGCPRALTAIVLPLSYSFNLSGTYVYIGAALVFLAQAARVDLGVEQLLAMIGVALLTSRAAIGVAGSGFATLTTTVSVLRIVPLDMVAILLGIDRTMKCRLLANVIGHGVACIALAACVGGLDRAAMKSELAPRDRGRRPCK